MIPCEELLDGEVVAFHYLESDSGLAEYRLSKTSPVPLYGPLAWLGIYRFPENLSVEFAAVDPKRLVSVRNGRPIEIETYEVRTDGGWQRSEVSYDPAAGFLPRFVRMIAFNEAKDRAWVKETYLIDAVPCATGGFIPKEWYALSFSVDHFMRQNPKYGENTFLGATGPVSLIHYVAGDISRTNGPPGLEKLENIRAVATAGGRVRLGPTPHRMTLDNIKRLIGKQLRTLPRPLPSAHLDEKELVEFERPQTANWLFPLLVCLLAGALIAGGIRLRRSRRLLLLLLLVTCGCAPRARAPVARLSAVLVPSQILYKPGDGHGAGSDNVDYTRKSRPRANLLFRSKRKRRETDRRGFVSRQDGRLFHPPQELDHNPNFTLPRSV